MNYSISDFTYKIKQPKHKLISRIYKQCRSPTITISLKHIYIIFRNLRINTVFVNITSD